MSDDTPANGRRPPDPFVRRVRLRNYKSIAHCDVELGPLTVLVGRNGAGKSNFLDSLAFVRDALALSLDQALKLRGGIREVLHRGGGSGRIEIKLDLDLEPGRRACYEIWIKPRRNSGFFCEREELEISGDFPARYKLFATEETFPASYGNVSHLPLPSSEGPLVASADHLFLVGAASNPRFHDVLSSLRSIGIYKFDTSRMRVVQAVDAGGLLETDGANIAGSIMRLAAGQPEVWQRVQGYLRSIVPGLQTVCRVGYGAYQTVRFLQRLEGSHDTWEFDASAMSDGTLRALATLVAVAQLADGVKPVRLVGIEEPEAALHPAASGALMDALKEAAVSTQVIVTTHSPDLLDHLDPDDDRILVAEARGGGTVIAPIDRASREAIDEQLYSPGELLRMRQLEPDYRDLERQQSELKPPGRAE